MYSYFIGPGVLGGNEGTLLLGCSNFKACSDHVAEVGAKLKGTYLNYLSVVLAAAVNSVSHQFSRRIYHFILLSKQRRS